MLTKRIIPCLDVTGGRVVKGISFENLRDAGDPVELAAFYNRQGADELVFLDITASSDNRATLIDVVERTADQVFIPLTVGGGLRSVEDIRLMLAAGADKTSLNTAAIATPELILQGAKKFGTQCIVIAIDAKRRQGLASPGESRWEVYSHGGRKPTGLDVLAWAKRAVALGAGEILLTSMDADGRLSGYDLDLLAEVSTAVSVPVIASGGVGVLEHLYQGVCNGADAVLAASIFHYGTYSIQQAKTYLAGKGIAMRMPENGEDNR